MTKEDLNEKIKGMSLELIEHCDAVLILVSVDDCEDTYLIHSRRGSWHAVLGLMSDYSRKTQADTAAEFTVRELRDNGTDGIGI